MPPSSGPIAWLDYGCGAGGLLKFLRDRRVLNGRSLELTGHDVGSYADLLRDVDGFRMLGMDEVATEPGERYDVITSIEVVEHLPEPEPVFANMARLLKPGGLLILTTGNMHGRAARAKGIHYRYCLPEVHVSLFSPPTLRFLYDRHGLHPRAVRYDGVVRFKALKTLKHLRRLNRAVRAALAVPPVVRLIDWYFGVSAMPCAMKPLRQHNAETASHPASTSSVP